LVKSSEFLFINKHAAKLLLDLVISARCFNKKKIKLLSEEADLQANLALISTILVAINFKKYYTSAAKIKNILRFLYYIIKNSFCFISN